jgi:hypothetical protein
MPTISIEVVAAAIVDTFCITKIMSYSRSRTEAVVADEAG